MCPSAFAFAGFALAVAVVIEVCENQPTAGPFSFFFGFVFGAPLFGSHSHPLHHAQTH
jgi:hypothetical protein